MKLKQLYSWIKCHFWKITVSVIAICSVAVATFIGIAFYISFHGDNNIKISENLEYRYNKGGGYIYNVKTNEKVIPVVDHVVTPKDNDSIAVFHWGKKRGYFNINTGEILVQPKFDAAWLFRSGVGAVVLNDSVFFIGLDGKPISDNKFPRTKGEDYLFEGDYCVIKIGSKYGAIDKSGEWVLEPEWEYIESTPLGILMACVNKMPIFIYDKTDIRPYIDHIVIKEDTVVLYSDSIRTYIKEAPRIPNSPLARRHRNNL